MRHSSIARWSVLGLVLIGSIVAAGGEAPLWHMGLYVGNGAPWLKRVAVTLRNDTDQPAAGEPVTLTIGKDAGQADLVGTDAAAVRACTALGEELLFAILGPDGKPVVRGPIAAGSRLLLPAECAARSSATLYVYFDNAQAWPVPDFLDAKAKPSSLIATAGMVEACPLRTVAPRADWAEPRAAGRAAVRVANATATGGRRWVGVDGSALIARLSRGNSGGGAWSFSVGGEPVARVGDSFVFRADAPAMSLSTAYVYPVPGASAGDVAGYAALLNDPANLVKNPSFEQQAAGGAPAEWSGNGQLATDAGGRFGSRCAKLVVGENRNRGWFGFRQDVPIQGGRTYLLAAWVKCQDVRDGAVQMHVHFHRADHTLTAAGGMTSTGTPITGTTDWTLMSGLLQAPLDAAFLQLHLTTNAGGTIWYDGIVAAEVSTGTLGKVEGRSGGGSGGDVTAWTVNAIVKVFREDVPPEKPAAARITAARNEKEPLQVAIRSQAALGPVKVTSDAPTHASGAKLPAPSIAVVGYVPIDHKTSYYLSDVPAWHRKLAVGGGSCDGWAGWWPDPLLLRSTFDLAADQTQPVWLTFAVPKTAAAGDYRGSVKFAAAGGKVLAEVPYTLHVWDFSLDDESHVKAVYDLRVGKQWREPGKDPRAAWDGLSRFMAEHRTSPDRIDPEPIIKYENGKVTADFAAYDKAGEIYFNELHHNHTYTPAVFYCFGWAHPPKKVFGQEPYEGKFPYEGVDRSKLRPQYVQAYQACLKVYLDHMRAKGWYDKVLLYVSDEPHYYFGKDQGKPIVAQMKALCAMIHEVDANVPIYSSTWEHVPEWDGSVTAWGFGAHGSVPVEKMRQVQQGGARIVWTVDGWMCTDTPYCAIERLLPHYCFKYGVEGYEFWGFNWLTYDPYEFGWHSFIRQADSPGHDYYTRYPNGDGFLCYPGAPVGVEGPISSVRLEQAREGVEDYEYLWLLRDRIAKAAGKDTTAAKAALEAAQNLVSIPNPGGRYSTKILPDPDAVFVAKENVARAIEGLK